MLLGIPHGGPQGERALAAEHVPASCPTPEVSWCDGVGHARRLEAPERELAAMVRRVHT